MEAEAYPDSSFLVSLHRADSHYAAANSFLKKAALSLAFTPLHRIEVRNAWRNAVARGDMTAFDCRIAFRQIDDDLREGLLVHTPVDWTEVFQRAEELSAKQAGRDGQRTIDLLHVSLALECRAKIFLTFDTRQRKLAQAAGLRVKP